MTCTINHMLIERGVQARELGHHIMEGNMKTTKTAHMGITIQFIEEMAQETRKGVGHYFDNLTDEEAQAYLDDLKAKGFRLLPTCDNVDAEGQCAGHAKS